MADLLRKDKTTASADKRDCPFVVQIVVPDGGFGCTPDAVNAWKHYRRRRQGRLRRVAGQEFWHRCYRGEKCRREQLYG